MQFLVLLMTCPSLCNDTVLIDRVEDIADMLQRQVLTVRNYALGLVVDMPVVVHVKVVDIPVVTQRLFPTCSPRIRWSMSWLCRSWGAGREESVEIPQLLLVVWTPLLTCPLVCNNRCWVLTVLGTALCACAQGQGLTPAIRAGKGWRGRQES